MSWITGCEFRDLTVGMRSQSCSTVTPSAWPVQAMMFSPWTTRALMPPCWAAEGEVEVGGAMAPLWIARRLPGSSILRGGS